MAINRTRVNLSAELDALIEDRAKQLLEKLLSSNAEPSNVDDSEPVLRTSDNRDDADDDRPVRRARKRGRGRAKVGYVTTRYGAAKRKGDIDALIPTWAETFKAVKAANGLVTAYELEKSTGMPKKTIESSLFNLRQQRLIVSKPLPRQSAAK